MFAQVPAFGHVDANIYLQNFQLNLGTKPDKLYSAGFLKFVRSASHQDNFYYKSQCRAEMRKNVTYVVDVVVDKYSTVLQCQCECAAGMGPTAHCKHVRAVLYALCEFTKTKSVRTEQTCTQRLQTFHKTKTYKGSPLKAHTLRSSLLCNKALGSQPTTVGSDRLHFDPRPEELRKSDMYSSYVRNLAINFAAAQPSSAQQMPLMQLHGPANPYSLESDHCYQSDTMSDSMLVNNHITSITPEVAKSIEVDTRGQASNKRWFQERCQRICSSKFGRICKATKRTDLKKLAYDLTHPVKFFSASTQYGRENESKALQKYEQITGHVVHESGLCVSLTHPMLAASPDGIVNDELLVEVKCPYTARNDLITPDTVPYLFKGDSELLLDTRHNYFYQIQGQLFATGRQMCHLVVYTAVDCKVVNVDRDDIFIDHMVLQLESFFRDYFVHALKDKWFYRRYDQFCFE